MWPRICSLRFVTSGVLGEACVAKDQRRDIDVVPDQSPVITEEREASLLALFPEVASDGTVDLARLAALLGDAAEVGTERYTFSWAGKRDSLALLRLPSRATLVPDSADSLDFDSTRNVFIVGDNLEVMKLLHAAYFGRVKMIYLDPPYNTDGDLIYRDNYTDPLAAYLEYTGQQDEHGNLLTSNTEVAGRYHSAWLSMMYPRLSIARQFLAENGVLFVSCNDIEQAHLRLLLNEIFGEENFVATYVWNNEGNIDNQSKIKVNHEYIHMYARSLDAFERPTVIDPNIEETSKLYKDEIENSITKNGKANPPSKIVLPAGFPATFQSGAIEARTNKFPKLHSKVQVKDFALSDAVLVESGWSSRNLLELFISNGFQPILDGQGRETRFALTDTGAIYSYKVRGPEQGHVLTVIRNVGTTKQNSSMLAKWGLKFDWPKPVRLIEYLCQIVTAGDDIVLDLFGGAGTTAHAVLNANRRDGGARRFVLVQLPEKLDEPSVAASGRSLETIADIGLERIRSAADDLAHTPSLLADSAAEDLGVRVFHLLPSFLRPWVGVEERDGEAYVEQMGWFTDRLIDGWTEEGLLWELALREGFSLASSFEKLDIPLNSVWLVRDPDADAYFYACLDDTIAEGTPVALGLAREDVLVCRDIALTDELIANLSLQCRLKAF